MAELGIDISRHRSKSVEGPAGQQFDPVITVCDRANEQCPIFLGLVRKLHLGFANPAKAGGSEEEIMAAFRKVRDEIQQKLVPILQKEAEAAATP